MSKPRKFNNFDDDFSDYSYREEEKSYEKERRAKAKNKQARRWQNVAEWSQEDKYGTESN
jgi:hypothetical protein